MGPAVAVLEHGGRGIYAAAALWALVGDPRAEQLSEFVERKLRPAGEHVLDCDAIAELVDLLAGVGEAVRKTVTDERLIVRADQVDRVLQWSARRVHRAPDGEREAWTLDEPVAQAVDAERFLRRALAGGCSVVVE